MNYNIGFQDQLNNPFHNVICSEFVLLALRKNLYPQITGSQGVLLYFSILSVVVIYTCLIIMIICLLFLIRRIFGIIPCPFTSPKEFWPCWTSKSLFVFWVCFTPPTWKIQSRRFLQNEMTWILRHLP